MTRRDIFKKYGLVTTLSPMLLDYELSDAEAIKCEKTVKTLARAFKNICNDNDEEIDI